MSNKSSSKQHGLVGNIRPKSKLRKRRNKALANQRKADLRKITGLGLSKTQEVDPKIQKKSGAKKAEKAEVKINEAG